LRALGSRSEPLDDPDDQELQVAAMDLYEAWHREVLDEGEARALSQVLAARGFELRSEQAARFRECEEREEFEEWLRRAATATRVSDVFD
jgi:hypothetical protein